MRAILVFLLSCALYSTANAATVKFTTTTYTVNVHPVLVQTGDFNGDGIPDVITANGILGGKSTLTVWLGNGDGTLRKTKITHTQQIEHIALGDFNRDGKLDLVVAGGFGIRVFLGNGNGTFQSGVYYATGTNTVSVTTGDFNGDGKLDIAAANNMDDNISV